MESGQKGEEAFGEDQERVNQPRLNDVSSCLEVLASGPRITRERGEFDQVKTKRSGRLEALPLWGVLDS